MTGIPAAGSRAPIGRAPACPARISPAIAGPPIIAAWNVEKFSDRAPESSAAGTSLGMSDWRAGPSNALAAPARKFRA